MQSLSSSVASIDVGYGRTKAKTANGEATILSMVGPAIRIDYEGMTAAGYNGLTVEIDGRAYFVGQRAAIQSPNPVSPQSRQRDLEIVKILALTALHVAHAPAEISRLVTGLPVAWYYDDKDALREILLGKHILTINGEEITFNIAEVIVMPQPMGTIFLSMLNPNGMLTDPRGISGQIVGTIDIGMYTTDIALIDNKK